MNNSICIIPARGGSKRIPKKNIKNFFGKPIISYAIQNAIKSNLFNKIIVSTDDKVIKDISLDYGAEVPFMRSESNSDDHASTISVINEVVETLKIDNKSYKNILCLYPCTPLISVQHIKESYNYFNSKNFKSLATIKQFSSSPFRSLSKMGDLIIPNSLEINNKRTQDLKKLYHDAGQFYWIKTKYLDKSFEIFNSETTYYELSEMDSHDIDTKTDWLIAKIKYNIKYGNKIL